MPFRSKNWGVGFKKIALKLFLIGLFSSICLISPFLISRITIINHFTPYLSNSDIAIFTPENITYTEPMSGHYPGTFSFDDVADGAQSPYWIGGVDGEIFAEIGGHKKVYGIIDNSGSTGGDVRHEWASEQDHGTIESWMRFTSNSQGCAFYLRRDGANYAIISINGGNFLYLDNMGTHNISGAPTPQVDTWYHIRFDFRGSYGSTYLGLASQYTYRIYIDGVAYGPYSYAVNDDLNRFQVHTAIAADSLTVYWDAVGYSWDPNYSIGDNLNEGLLLSFDTTFTPDWIGYSFDGQFLKTILGNSTILFPITPGRHTIQVFGNDSLGTIYESDIRYFTVKFIKIFIPENMTYSEPMSGYYPGTFSFDDVADGAQSPYWIGGVDGEIFAEIGNHKKVYGIIDNSGSTGGDVKHEWAYSQDHGTIESWMRFTNSTQGSAFYIRLDGLNLCVLAVGDDSFKYLDNTGSHDIVGAPTPQTNTWYHIRFDFRGSYGSTYQGLVDQYTYRIYINGVPYGHYNYAANNDLNQFRAHTGVAADNVTFYWDAVGYSWDPNYSIGDNLNEGLLLSFENHTNLDWIGYSLNSQLNKTILGNSTIPFPSNDGLHSIQVFGNTTGGVIYDSDVRYFTTDRSAPLISGINYVIELEQYSYFPLHWNVYDISGGTYIILKNGSIESMGSFQNNDIISIILDTAELGYSNYTLITTDAFGRVSSHTVMVKIIEEHYEPMIPGFNVLTLFCIIIITVGILNKTKIKHKK